MKKLTILLMTVFLGLTLNAQKKNGTVFSEHESIDKTKALWAALVEGDRDAFVNFFTDSVFVLQNGKGKKYPKKSMANFVTYWSGFEKLKIEDDPPSYPDAIEYKTDGLWVVDLLKFTGTHKETGVISDLHLHSLYRFNDDNKISVISMYYDANFFDEVADNSKTIENGTVYINHPYIVKVRKLLNAYAARDLEKWEEYFAPNATFINSSMKPGEYMSLAERKVEMKDLFSTREKISFTQVGYPDCIHYANGDGYMVFSWWTATDVNKDGEVYEFRLFLTHNINDDGKVTSENAYFSYQAKE